MGSKNYGTKHFHEGLKSEAATLAGRVVREQLTHSKYLALRSEVMQRPVWERSTSRAQTQFLAYLEGAIEMLHGAQLIVWKHRSNIGTWLSSPLPEGISYQEIDSEQSRHVWATSDKVWFDRPSAESERAE